MRYNIQLEVPAGVETPIALRIIYEFFSSKGYRHNITFLTFIPIRTIVPAKLVKKEETILKEKIVDCIFDPTSFETGTEINVLLNANGDVYWLPLNENREPVITIEEFFTPKKKFSIDKQIHLHSNR